MPTINVTDLYIDGRIKAVQQWLVDNVGQFYGRGEYRVLEIGSGWEIRAVEIHDDTNDDSPVYLEFVVDITDEAKATAFALRWL